MCFDLTKTSINRSRRVYCKVKQRLEEQKKEVLQQEAGKTERAIAANLDATSEERVALRRKYDFQTTLIWSRPSKKNI
jgi:hypothetical protein